MGLVEELQKTINEKKSEFEKDSSFNSFKELYEELNKKGLILKQSYNIPLVNTLGIISFENPQGITKNKCSNSI